MSFCHSTPTKPKEAQGSPITEEPFHQDFIEWREDPSDVSLLLIDSKDDYMLLNWDQKSNALLQRQNIGKPTPKQRFVLAVRTVGRVLGVLKMMRRVKLQKELDAIEQRRRAIKAAVKKVNLFDTSELSYFSLDDSNA